MQKNFEKVGIFYIVGNPSINNVLKSIKLAFLEENITDLTIQNGQTESNNIDIIIAIGGDGTILQCIKKYSFLNVPFIGINQGKLGFLTNIINQQNIAEELRSDLLHLQVPIFECEIHYLNGENKEQSKKIIQVQEFINDVNIFRSSGQSAQLNIKINNHHSNIVNCDGVVAFSPLGSTGYNASLGGYVMEMDSKSFGMKIVSMNTRLSSMKESYVKLKPEDILTIENQHYIYRPCNCGIDGSTIINVVKIEIKKTQKLATVLFKNKNWLETRKMR